MMTLLTGCNVNTPQDSTTSAEKEDNTPVAAKATYAFGTHEDQLKVLNVTIEYYDSDGTKKQEAVKETTWSKSVQSQSLPATFGMRILYKLNTNYSISPTKTEHIGYYFSYTSSTVNKTGKQVGEVNAKSIDVDEDCASGKIESWIKSYSSHPSSLLIKYDSKGNATTAAWE